MKRHSIIVMCGSHKYEFAAPTARRCQRHNAENVLRCEHAVLSAEQKTPCRWFAGLVWEAAGGSSRT